MATLLFPRRVAFESQQPGGPVFISSVVEDPANVFWVHHGGSSSGGYSPDNPITTLAGALALATTGQGDSIRFLPGHNENIGNAQIAVDKAVRLIYRGPRALRPRFDFDHANASIDITASGVEWLGGVRLLPSVTGVLIGIDVNAAAEDVTLEDVEILPGEDGAGVDEFALGIDVKAGCSRLRILRPRIRQHASAAGCLAGIRLTGATDDVEIVDADIVTKGAGAVAPINGITTLSTNVRIVRPVLVSDDEPGIELLTGTTGLIDTAKIFTNLATVAAAIVADGMALFDCEYIEVAPERGVLIGTASADD